MAGDRNRLPAERRRAGKHVLMRAVMLDHVQVGGGEVLDRAPEVPGNGDRFQEDLRQDHGGSDVEDHRSLSNSRDHLRQAVEIGEGGLAQRRAVAAGMLMDDVGSDRHVDGGRDPGPVGGRED